MERTPLHRIVAQLRQAVGRSESAGVTDEELLQRFRTRRDQEAFELLVWRHGGMVF